MVKFTIRDGDYLPYEDIKKDYMNGLVGKALCDKYGITTRAYKSLRNRLKEDGVKLARPNRVKKQHKPSYVYRTGSNNWMVQKLIDGEYVYKGCFPNRALAEKRARELGWIK